MSHSLLRVAYLCEFPSLLGGERSLLTFLDVAASVGVEPTVVAPRDGALSDALRRRRIDHLPWPQGGHRNAPQLAPEVRRRAIDLVHGNSLMIADAAGALGATAGLPAVNHVRDIMTLSDARRDRLRSLAAVIAVSDAVREWLIGIGFPADRVARVYNAVDRPQLLATASPGALRRELGAPPHMRLVGCIGQIALRKGQDLFVRAVQQLAVESPDVGFVLVGERHSNKAESVEFEAQLHAWSRQPPLASRTWILGLRDDVPDILADLDVVVVPSRQEPLSRVLLESLALGIPAVATAVGGSQEILTSAYGALVAPEAQALAAGMQRVLNSPEMAAAARRDAAQRAQKFSPLAHAAQIRELYDRVLDGGDI